ncbi:MAG TPA: deoxyribose-phosphate aldolase [Candidatus Sulfotelmatobacter sp.]|nr:deoxyribose-phosphate aldolase [Candidatus Sulfotelmatobacter sp.]
MNKSDSGAVALASKIQSTIISNVLTQARWEQHIAECLKYRFQAAMIPAAWVKKTAEVLHGSGIKVASFVDFPYGTMTSLGKAYETARLIENGAEEVDLMPNVGFLLSGMEREYANDISGVVKAAGKMPVKIMLELPLLDVHQKERAVALSIDAGVAYLKNASGGAVGVATPEQIAFLRRLAPPNVRVKASGGIRTAQQALDLVKAGADLVGTSSGAEIMGQLGDGNTSGSNRY